MSMLSHLEALERRHEALDKEIEDVMKTHPSIDPLQIKALKRKKLHVKDEIARLKEATTMH